MLFKAPTNLNAREGEILQELDQLKGEVAFAFEPKRWFGSLRRLTTAKAIRASIGIEGYMVSVEDAIAALEQEEPLDAKNENRAALFGYREALTLVLQKADDEHFRHSREFLNALHFILMSYDLASHPGRWRTGDIFVIDSKNETVVYTGPPDREIVGLMAELVNALNDREEAVHPVIRAAMAHLNFVMIHPHSDGNGRMARALQTLVLTREWETRNPMFTSIEQYLGGERTDEYYDVLARVGRGSWNPTMDTRPWIDFCLTAHYRQAKYLQRTGSYFEQLYGVLESELERCSLPDRCLPALAEAAMGLRLANGTYRKAADVSPGTASRDLAAMVEAELLVRHGSKRGTYYVQSPRTAKVAERLERPGPVEDPFESFTPSEQGTLF